MPRRRDRLSPEVVHRTARAGLRVTRAQRRRRLALLASAGDAWACVLEINAWRRARQDRPLVSYQALCRELAASGPGCFGELDTAGARSVLRRYSDAWFAAAQRRRSGDHRARFPRRRRALVPLRWYHGRFTLAGRRLRIPVARGRPALWVRLDRALPYPPDQVRSVTLLYDAGRLWVDVTAEVPVTAYPAGLEPDPGRVAGVDLGIIHPYAVAGPDGEALLVSGRAIRAEHRMHRADSKARQKATARRAPKPGQKGSRRWRHYRHRQRLAEARHRRRVRQAQHEAAKTVITWAVARRVGLLAVGDPRGVLRLKAGRRHNQRTRDWRIGHLITALADKAEAAGIQPATGRRARHLLHLPRLPVPGPQAARAGPGLPGLPVHRPPRPHRSGQHRRPYGRRHHAGHPGRRHAPPRRAHLPGIGPSRRDPRRRAHDRGARGSPGRHRPAARHPSKYRRGVARHPGEEPELQAGAPA
jgi:transposase